MNYFYLTFLRHVRELTKQTKVDAHKKQLRSKYIKEMT